MSTTFDVTEVLGEGMFSMACARDSLGYLHQLNARIQRELYEQKREENEKFFQQQAQERERRRQQFVVKAPTQAQLEQLQNKFRRK